MTFLFSFVLDLDDDDESDGGSASGDDDDILWPDENNQGQGEDLEFDSDDFGDEVNDIDSESDCDAAENAKKWAAQMREDNVYFAFFMCLHKIKSIIVIFTKPQKKNTFPPKYEFLLLQIKYYFNLF